MELEFSHYLAIADSEVDDLINIVDGIWGNGEDMVLWLLFLPMAVA